MVAYTVLILSSSGLDGARFTTTLFVLMIDSDAFKNNSESCQEGSLTHLLGT